MDGHLCLPESFRADGCLAACREVCPVHSSSIIAVSGVMLPLPSGPGIAIR